MPIYENEVAKMFSFARPYQKEFDFKLKRYSEQFEEIKKAYEQIDELNFIPKTIECFDQTFKNNKLSKMKKLDFIFWSAGKIKTRQQQ